MAYVTNICRRCHYDNDPQAISCVKCCAPLAVDRPAHYENPPQYWFGPLAALALVLVVFAVSRPASQGVPVDEEEMETPPIVLTSDAAPRRASSQEYELVWEMPEGSPNPRMLARRRQEMFRDRLAAIEERDKTDKLPNSGQGGQPANSALNTPRKRKVLTDIARQIRATTDSGSLNGIRSVIALATDPSDTNFNARLTYLDQAAVAKMGTGAANSRMSQQQKNFASDASIRRAFQ